VTCTTENGICTKVHTNRFTQKYEYRNDCGSLVKWWTLTEALHLSPLTVVVCNDIQLSSHITSCQRKDPILHIDRSMSSMKQQTSNWNLLLIYRPRRDERLNWPGWLTYSRQFTHISGYPSAAGRAQDRAVRRPKTNVLPLFHATIFFTIYIHNTVKLFTVYQQYWLQKLTAGKSLTPLLCCPHRDMRRLACTSASNSNCTTAYTSWSRNHVRNSHNWEFLGRQHIQQKYTDINRRR